MNRSHRAVAFFSLISLHTPFPLPLISNLLAGAVYTSLPDGSGHIGKRGVPGTRRSVSSKGREESRGLVACVRYRGGTSRLRIFVAAYGPSAHNKLRVYFVGSRDLTLSLRDICSKDRKPAL